MRIRIPRTERLDPALPTSQFRPGWSLHLERALPLFAVQSLSILKGPGGRLPSPGRLPPAPLLPAPQLAVPLDPSPQRRPSGPRAIAAGGEASGTFTRPQAERRGSPKGTARARGAGPRTRASRPHGHFAPSAGTTAREALPGGLPGGARAPISGWAPSPAAALNFGCLWGGGGGREPARTVGVHESDPPEQVVPAGGGRTLRSPYPFLLSERASPPGPGVAPGQCPGAQPLVPLAPAAPAGGQRGPAGPAGGRRRTGRAGRPAGGAPLLSPGAASALPRPAPPRGGPASPHRSQRPGLDPHQPAGPQVWSTPRASLPFPHLTDEPNEAQSGDFHVKQLGKGSSGIWTRACLLPLYPLPPSPCGPSSRICACCPLPLL